MAVGKFCRREGDRHPFLAGNGQGVAQAFVVWLHAENAGDQGAVGAVALVGFGEGAVEQDLGPDWRLTEQRARHQADARRAGCVGAGRPDHDGTEDVEYVHRA